MAESNEFIIRQLRASVEAAERKRDEFASSASLAADRANRNRAEVEAQRRLNVGLANRLAEMEVEVARARAAEVAALNDLAEVQAQRDELQARLEQLTAPVESFDLAWLRQDGDPCCHCGTPLSQHGREDHDFVESLPVEEILAREVVRLRAAVEVPRG